MKQLMLTEILIIHGGFGECICKLGVGYYYQTIKYSADIALVCYNTCCNDNKGTTWLFVSTIIAANFSDKPVFCEIK